MKSVRAEDDQSVKNWMRKDKEAHALMGLNMSSNIAAKTSSCSMLSKLKTYHGKKSDITVEGLRKQLIGYKYDERKSVVENFMAVRRIADLLERKGEMVKESWIMSRVLNMLPPKSNHFGTSWSFMAPTDKNLDKLV
ncbi:hypothetical protein QAD02_007019 [Eretmocerus hayati]|uniref:Uncharacterized protein n=1 Tax=Eretmocerus hayati TaxID=131215 RepID=A0ACC2N2J6_9HYME|nr:hypothetical protein QAD02_007019 [Eretmocerus hayati]